MTLTAVGTGVQRNDDGTVTVSVNVVKPDGGVLKALKVTGIDLADVQAQLRGQLAADVAALEDVSLSDRVVGKMLAKV